MQAADGAFGRWVLPWYESQNIQIGLKTSKLKIHQISGQLAEKCYSTARPRSYRRLLKSTESFLQMCHCLCLLNPSAAGDALICLDRIYGIGLCGWSQVRF